MYSAFVNSTCSWICCRCGLPNFPSMLFDTFNISSQNQYNSLFTLSSPTDMSSLLSQASTSCKTRNNSHSVGRPQHSSSPLECSMSTVCQSVVNKKEQFHAIIEETKPDIIVGTESWLQPDIKDTEIFPPNFTVYR